MDMGKIEDWLSTIPSEHTRKNYIAGIKKFEQYYGKGIETLIGSQDSGKVIEKFYVWLRERHGQNSCRNLVNAPIQFLKYFGTEPKYRKSLGMYRTVPTTRDHRATIQEIQNMAKVADLRDQILLEVYLLGLRISDVALLEWQTFDQSGQTPIPIEINTQKEQVVARTFISEEFKGLLDMYLPTLDKSNIYLFQSKRSGHLTTKGIDYTLKNLVRRAGIINRGLFRWHTGRKLFLRTCAELGISSWSAKLMCGKAIPSSDDTYVHDADLRNAFLKVSSVLKLFPVNTSVQSDVRRTLDVVLQTIKALLEDKLKQEGLLQKTGVKVKSIDWLALYEQILPEEEKPEKVQFT